MVQYAKRRIDLTLNYGLGEKGDTPGKDVTLTGMRISAAVVHVNASIQGQAQIRIFGLPLDMLNQLTIAPQLMQYRRQNSLLVAAGDEDGSLSVIYQGITTSAVANFQGMPEVVFSINSLSAALDAVKPVAASSYVGTVDAATIMADLAKVMGIPFENNGVSVMLANPYFPGTAWEQVKSCAKAARISFAIERGKLAIWPLNGFRQQSSGPILVSSRTGMVGYPEFAGNGVVIRTLFNPDIIIGGQVKIESDLTVACGTWNVYGVAHVLESETPNGQWFTQVNCGPVIPS